MDQRQQRFLEAALRKRLRYFGLSAAGIAVAVALTCYYGYQRWLDTGYPLGLRAVLVILILLNARQNLRQYRYAALLRLLAARDQTGGGPEPRSSLRADDPAAE